MSESSEKKLKDFQKVQLNFAQHLRDPEHSNPPENIEDRRLKIYRDLFFSNIKGLVTQTFPVLRQFYSQEQWDKLIREFMIGHKAHTPMFLEVSSEFVEFLQNTYQPGENDPPFMLELAHYEWVELAVSVMDVEPELDKIDPDGDLLLQSPY
ncbi:MAG: DUF2063 domain-containing protein, partial [Gammaproteobacteria bacterium]|nr:DUF2063 domain-containing protein [Gammaproteobacteria bacterium]